MKASEKAETNATHPFAWPERESGFPLRVLLREIARKLNAGTDFDKVFDFVFESMALVLPFDRLGIALLTSDQRLELRWIQSKIPARHLKKGYSAPLSQSLKGVIELGKPRIINNLEDYAIQHPESTSTKSVLSDGLRSSLTCPLTADGKVIGAVFFSSNKIGSYNETHVEAFQELADELSLLVEFGRLHSSYTVQESKTKNFRMVIHDLRSPLSIVRGCIETLIDENKTKLPDPNISKLYDMLQRNTDFMFEMINDLSNMGMLSEPKKVLDLKCTNVEEFVAKVASDGEMLAAKKQIAFEFYRSESVPSASLFDELRIKRVLENLISNAIKFSWADTKVSFRVEFKDGNLVFLIKDNGQGIPKDEIPLLFKEFGRTSVRPTAGENSTGLGLAIAKTLIEAHDGKIEVESDVNSGSTFRVILPYVACGGP